MTPDDLHTQALALLMDGDTASGISGLEAYLDASPNDPRAWLELGAAYASLDRRAEAEQAYGRSVALDGDDVDARLAYARALMRGRRFEEAASHLLHAAALDPRDGRVLLELGIVFYDEGDYDKAASWLEEAIEHAPEAARAHATLGLVHEARGDLGAAIGAYRTAVRLDPGYAAARQALADVLASMGEHEGALAEVSALLEADPTNAELARNRKVLLRTLDDMKKRRLLGKSRRALEASVMLDRGAFRNRGPVPGTAPRVVRFEAPLAEVYAALDEAQAIDWLLLVLTDPERAAATADDAFEVTVVTQDGRRSTPNYAIAVTLAFLREALGCPMTQASALFARLLAGEAAVDWCGARIAFDDQPRHGLKVSRAPA